MTRFRRPLPWGVAGGKPFLATADEANVALAPRLENLELPEWEAAAPRNLKRMLDAAGGDAGMLDSVVIAAAFERFAVDWHRRQRGTAQSN